MVAVLVEYIRSLNLYQIAVQVFKKNVFQPYIFFI